jgi:ankyrin repeat protein
MAIDTLSVVRDMVTEKEQHQLGDINPELEMPTGSLTKNELGKISSDISEQVRSSEVSIMARLTNLEKAQAESSLFLGQELEKHETRLLPHIQRLQYSIAAMTNRGQQSWEETILPSPVSIQKAQYSMRESSRQASQTTLWIFRGWRGSLGSITLMYSVKSRRHSGSRGTSTNWVSLAYTLPRWLFEFTLSIFYSTNKYGDPEFLIRVSKHFPKNDGDPTNIFGCIQRHDVQAAKQLFATRKASIYDTFGDKNSTTMTLAITYSDTDMAKLLLGEGCDLRSPEFSNHADTFPRIHKYWSFLYHKVGYPIPLSTFFEDAGLSELHEVVIGLRHANLDEALLNPRYRANIDAKDAVGCTPLHYATSMDKLDFVRTLMRHGASLEIRTSRWKSTALFEACLTGSTSSAVALLEAGADVDARNAVGASALRVACDYGGPKLVSALLKYGADIDTMKHRKNKCILDAVVYNDNSPVLEVLLDSVSHNVINDQDDDGDTVIFKAVQSRAPNCLRALLNGGGDYLGVNKSGWTILHKLAAHGTLETMAVFSDWVNSSSLDVNPSRRNKSGNTALDIFNARIAVSNEDHDAFFRIVRSVRAKFYQCPKATEIDQDESDEEFFDAPSIIQKEIV